MPMVDGTWHNSTYSFSYDQKQGVIHMCGGLSRVCASAALAQYTVTACAGSQAAAYHLL